MASEKQPVPLDIRSIGASAFGLPRTGHSMQERLTKLGIFLVRPPPERRPRTRLLLADTSHLRAEMHSLQMHRHAMRMHELHERVGDLLPDPFLNCEAPSEHSNQPGQLRDPDDLLVRDVADVGCSVERKRMMFTEREERDRSLDDLADSAVRDGLLRRGVDLLR